MRELQAEREESKCYTYSSHRASVTGLVGQERVGGRTPARSATEQSICTYTICQSFRSTSSSPIEKPRIYVLGLSELGFNSGAESVDFTLFSWPVGL